MAILVEALSVIIKDNSIRTILKGGIAHFYDMIPNSTYCTDGQLHRIGFMSPQDTEAFIRALQGAELTFLLGKDCADLAVVDMLYGPTYRCSWLGFARQKFFIGHTLYEKCAEDFSIAWLNSNNLGYGIPVDGSGTFTIAVPNNWNPDQAIYGDNFIPNDQIKKRLIELGNEGGVTKFIDKLSGKIVHVGRPKIQESGI